ncbi:MAG: ArsR family transcriptional regulator, arsenate/arsenite/antimonite-responsive transcriptional [Actinomycetota bacterium]|nr:ArsR family transcriptional regulator, arsenate/arsenite/antimonite-responsive transcriptional [Actinomycetota bacterium]
MASPTGTPPGGAGADGDAALLGVVADPSRLTILRILAEGPRCVCEVQAGLAIPANLLSYHLKVLREAGLIVGVRRGRWIDYHLAGDAAVRLHTALPLPCPPATATGSTGGPS